jgi:uncharacterized protein YoaH (UPF0181 family)
MAFGKHPPAARQRLRAFLKHLLEWEEDLNEPWTPERQAVFELLSEAVGGLDELDLGGFPEIFERVPLKTRGRLPARARMLERKAVESVALLHAMGRSVGEAKALVAKSYGKTVDVVDQWRKAFPKKDSAKHPHWRVRVYHTYAKWGVVPNEKGVLAGIAKDGEAYKKARIKKKLVK